MSAPTFRNPVTARNLQTQGGAWVLEYDSTLTLTFTPGITGNISPYLRHRILWGDGIEEQSEMLPTGRPYSYSHRYADPGQYTVTVRLINDAGEESGDANADGLFVLRQLPIPARRKDLVKYSGMCLPVRTIQRSFAALDNAFPEATTVLAAPARKGDTTILVTAAPNPSEGASLTIIQDGKFISSGLVILAEGNFLTLDAELESDYDPFVAQVTVRRADLSRGVLGEDPFKPEGWAFPRVTDRELVRGSLALLFGTRPFERVMKPEIGCRVHETVFEPSDFVTQQLLKAYLRDAAAPEPRASLAAIAIKAEGDEMTAKTTIQFKGFTDEIFDADLSLTTKVA